MPWPPKPDAGGAHNAQQSCLGLGRANTTTLITTTTTKYELPWAFRKCSLVLSASLSCLLARMRMSKGPRRSTAEKHGNSTCPNENHNSPRLRIPDGCRISRIIHIAPLRCFLSPGRGYQSTQRMHAPMRMHLRTTQRSAAPPLRHPSHHINVDLVFCYNAPALTARSFLRHTRAQEDKPAFTVVLRNPPRRSNDHDFDTPSAAATLRVACAERYGHGSRTWPMRNFTLSKRGAGAAKPQWPERRRVNDVQKATCVHKRDAHIHVTRARAKAKQDPNRQGRQEVRGESGAR